MLPAGAGAGVTGVYAQALAAARAIGASLGGHLDLYVALAAADHAGNRPAGRRDRFARAFAPGALCRFVNSFFLDH